MHKRLVPSEDHGIGPGLIEDPLIEQSVVMPAIPASLTIISGQPVSVSAKNKLPDAQQQDRDSLLKLLQDMDSAGPVPTILKTLAHMTPEEIIKNVKLEEIIQPRDEFSRAAKAHLKKEKSGDLTGQIVSGTMALKWRKLMEEPTYYPGWEDMGIILEHRGYYHELARDFGAYDGEVTLFELGSGTDFEKTRAMVNAIGPTNYITAECSMEAITETLENGISEFPEMGWFGTYIPDFNKNNMEKGLILAPKKAIRPFNPPMTKSEVGAERTLPGGRRVFVNLGTTMGNMEGFAGDPMPRKRVLDSLKNYRKHAQPGDILIMSIDQNQDERSLDECYGSDIHEELANDMMKRIEHSLPLQNFFPDDFSFTRIWNKTNHLYGLGWQAIRDMDFNVDGEPVHWSKYEVMLYTNSFRYPQKFMNSIYPEADWELVNVLPSKAKRMHHQVLRAVPGINHLSPTI